MILLGDCLQKLGEMETNSIDAIVTDPPYGLSFMNKKWDYDVPSIEVWREVIRVLKPGGHLLSFGGARTYHRMVVNIEDAGFEIRDQIQWLYGSGFPKSLDISKAIDKAAGAERKEVYDPQARLRNKTPRAMNPDGEGDRSCMYKATAPATEDAKKWQGFGTALKPANEPIVLARKPLEKGLTVAENVLKWGVGGLNIDGCRILGAIPVVQQPSFNTTAEIYNMKTGVGRNGEMSRAEGRFPANLILDETAAEMLDEQSGPCKTGVITKAPVVKDEFFKSKKPFITASHEDGNKIGASRFFYVAKASKSERNAGLEGMPDRLYAQSGGAQKAIELGETEYHTETQSGYDTIKQVKNHHPTVKPIKLMRYLCRLICPPGGTILDPFMGSGSTGIAAREENFKFIGIEIDPNYYEIARNRVEGKP